MTPRIAQNKRIPLPPINQKIDDRRPRFPLWEEWQDYEEEKRFTQRLFPSSKEYESITQENAENLEL